MTPDQLFARWVRAALIFFAIAFGYFLMADLWMPMTPQSRLLRPVVQVTPQVSGPVKTVNVANNARVNADQLLLTIDPQPYQLAVHQAEIALAAARQQNQQLAAALEAARAAEQAVAARVAELSREEKRLAKLLARNSVAQQQYDQARSALVAARAERAAAQSKIAGLEVQLGSDDETRNIRIRQAVNALEQAQLQLAYTQLKAQESGTLANLQVAPGSFAQAGRPLAALVGERLDLVADFREKSLSHVELGDEASVVFDAIPGEVFMARVESVDAGVQQGMMLADGQLAAPEETNRWVRSAQRQRLHLALQDTRDPRLQRLPSGARATVQLYPIGGLASALAHMQIHLLSWLHYIY